MAIAARFRGAAFLGECRMTPEQVSLVQQSFAQVVPIKTAAAGLFYTRLFEIDPSTRPLFGTADMGAQGEKLMATLGIVVKGLSAPETILPAAQALARRHVGYGVTAAQYGSVGAALLWTLGQGLGDAFTPAVAAAWTEAYGLVSGVMLEAAKAA
jgi:nitric oxide dioxygenase